MAIKLKLMKSGGFFIALMSIFLFGQAGLAKEFPAEARLFAGTTSVSPDEVNQMLTADSLRNINSTFNYGVEITYPAFEYLEAGVRYIKHAANEESPNASTSYMSKLDQDTVLLVARVPFYKSQLFRVDAFAGFGGSNTSLTIKSASENGELTKKAANGWFATPYSAYGASVAAGFKGFYFVVEGGYESNNVGNPDSSGLSHTISSINLSGSYFTVGIMFDGIKATTK